MSGLLRFRLSVLLHGVGYGLRGLFIAPAPIGERCIMGSPVHPWVWCPRFAVDLFCRVHRSPGWWNEEVAVLPLPDKETRPL